MGLRLETYYFSLISTTCCLLQGTYCFEKPSCNLFCKAFCWTIILNKFLYKSTQSKWMCLLQLPIDSMATRTLASNVVSLATLAMSCIHKAHTLLRLKPSFNLHCTPTYVWYILYIEAHNIECACSITYVISVCVCVCVCCWREHGKLFTIISNMIH